MPLPFALRALVAPLIVPIRRRISGGPNRGRQWSLASGQYLDGTDEAERMDVLHALIDEGDVVWDVGAHHGYVSLLASGRVGADGAVYALEPSPYNLTYLRKHMEWNGCDNVEVVPLALSDRDGTATFAEAGSSRTFQLGSGAVEVEIASVPTLLDRGFRPPDLLKLDVEGAEGDILAAAAPVLPPRCRVLVSIHSRANYDAASEALASAGFTVIDSPTAARLRDTEPGEWSDDPDLLGLGPECASRETALELFRAG